MECDRGGSGLGELGSVPVCVGDHQVGHGVGEAVDDRLLDGQPGGSGAGVAVRHQQGLKHAKGVGRQALDRPLHARPGGGPGVRHGFGRRPVVEAGGVPLAIHPAMTFTGTSLDLARLAECCFGITTPEALRPVAEALVVEMGGEPVWVPEEARGRYHAALAHGSNHLVTLVAQAMEILRSAGIDPADRVLRPLLQASLDNALSSGDAALTGPVARGDAGTVAAHLTELADLPDDVAAAYRAQARATALRAQRSGRLRGDDAATILTTLDEETR